jgi:4-diphosphocytidyl-2-C-methyl-D-erythritol kinase
MFTKRTSASSLIIGAPAKVNLDLRILGRRPDGFHEIDSIFQAVSLFDRLKFKLVEHSDRLELSLANDVNLEVDDSNLVVRAFNLMKQRFGFPGGLRVELEKNIPIAAGLGGGSSDGAATVLACRALFDLPLDFGQMAEISLELGSDLPFFFSSGQAHVTGRGEKITELELPTDYWMVLVTPDLSVSTAEAYAALKMPLTNPMPARSFRGWKAPADIGKWLVDIGNDFERDQLAAFPELMDVKKRLAQSGARLARLSGSGPTVFAIYSDAPNLEGGRAIGRTNWMVSTVRPIRLPARL